MKTAHHQVSQCYIVFVTDHFSGLGRAVGPVCVCVCVCLDDNF